ncbi:MAG: helix-hairpin-helix domain-containing protein [Planctomycetes bacterium]|nr:helix-hairpin-helix domain-containing protein [Planctomycetota bacterium]
MPFWPLRRRDQVTLAGLAVVALGAMAVTWWNRRDTLVELDRAPRGEIAYLIDVNTAPWIEIAQLPGVGETLAKRIVEHRQQHGPFERVEQLRQVRGMGPKTMEKIAGNLTVKTAESAQNGVP